MTTTQRRTTRRHRTRAALAVAAVAGLGGAAGFGWAQLERAPWMRVEDVTVRGLARLTPEEVVAYAGLTKRESLLRLSTEKLEERLAAHPWIKYVTVRRAWPPTVVIEVEERRPVAWVLDDRPWVIDADAHPFKAWDVADRLDLPVVTGIDSGTGEPGDAELTRQSLEEAVAMLDELARLEPVPSFDELHRGPEGRWSIVTPSGREVVLGDRVGAARAWERYRWLAPRLESDAGPEVLRVDVSDPRDAYVLTTAGGAPELHAARAATPRSGAARL